MPPRGAKQAAKKAGASPTSHAAATPAPDAADGSTLTEYELQRLAHIRRNQEYMARLGVLQARLTVARPIWRHCALCRLRRVSAGQTLTGTQRR